MGEFLYEFAKRHIKQRFRNLQASPHERKAHQKKSILPNRKNAGRTFFVLLLSKIKFYPFLFGALCICLFLFRLAFVAWKVNKCQIVVYKRSFG
jgi:hypothetical protein